MKLRRRNAIEFYGLMATLHVVVGVAFAVFLTPVPAPVLAEVVMPEVNLPPAKPDTVPAVVGVPVNIDVPEVGVGLEVLPGSYDASVGDWTLSYSHALHADSSMPLNDANGTTLLYAHALSGLFGELPSLQPGMIAHVMSDTGRVFRYTYRSSVEVLPSDTSVFTSKGPPTLVLQTCSGAWDTHRALYYFDFIDEHLV